MLLFCSNASPQKNSDTLDTQKKAYHCYFPAPSQTGADQGCQMVCFQTKNPNLGKNSGPHIGKC
jgi:hypothetical protein